jgi:hypothetical protein
VILAAGLLVLLGLGLFVGGVVTGTTALYWGCVAACGLAAVLLVVARVRTAREAGEFDRRVSGTPAEAAAPAAPGTTPPPVGTPGRAEAAPEPDAGREPAGATAVRTLGPPADPAPAPPADEPRAGEPAAQEPAAGPVAEEPPAVVPLSGPAADGRPEDRAPSRRGAHEPRESPADAPAGEPGEENVEVTDLVLVVNLDDEVLVVDEHPRYHLPGCPSLDGREAIPLPMVEARIDGFTPCATCRPVRHLADTERSRRRAARGN